MQEKVSFIYRASAFNNTASLAVIDTTALAERVARRLTSACAFALGRALTAAAYLCGWLKDESSSLSVTFDGGGPCGKIRVSGSGAMRLCGTVERNVSVPLTGDFTRDVSACVGTRGVMTVTRDDGRGLPFTGACALAAGDVERDLEAYFAESEQRPTAAFFTEAADAEGKLRFTGGIFYQPLPGGDSDLSRAREVLRNLPPAVLAEEDGAERVLSAFGAENADKRKISFGCSCSRRKAKQAVLAMGEDNVRLILREQGFVSVRCHNCDTEYRFGKELFPNGKEKTDEQG